MASTAKVIIEEPPSEEADAKEPKRVSSRHQAHEDAARKSTNSKRNLLGSGAGATELQTGDGGTPPASQRTPKRSPPKRGATAGTLAARPAVARSPTSLKVAGEVATPERESPAYMGRSRHAARPWKPSTAHLSHVEEREPKGWTLSHILSKAKWSMAMSKAFSPHININDPNRIKVRHLPISPSLHGLLTPSLHVIPTASRWACASGRSRSSRSGAARRRSPRTFSRLSVRRLRSPIRAPHPVRRPSRRSTHSTPSTLLTTRQVRCSRTWRRWRCPPAPLPSPLQLAPTCPPPPLTTTATSPPAPPHAHLISTSCASVPQPLVHLLVEGFNGTIFAYGQTGSGKTHSMMGNSSDPGITPRVTTELFDVLNKIGEGGKCTYQVRVSYLQIYREVLHDLLAGKSKSDAPSHHGY